MGNLNLTALTDKSPYIQKIKAALEKAAGQSIPLVETAKVQLIRTAQPKIEQKNKKDKVNIPRRPSNSVPQQLEEKREEETKLDQEILDSMARRDQLLQQLEQTKTQSA